MRTYPIQFAFCFLAFLTFYSNINAQNLNSAQSHHHDFDFWIGNWDVYKYGTDTLVGLSNISPTLNHKVIEEKYQSVNYPYKGTSNNIFNAQEERWEQYWVDNSGLALHIVGGLKEGKMVLSNCADLNCNKIVWSPNSDKTVRQEWFQSKDNGANWTKIFDGHYKAHKSQSLVEPALTHLIAYPNIRDFTISTDGTEAYITVQNPGETIRTICKMVMINGNWSQPVPASFSGKHKDIEPYLSPDNLRLYFASNRPNSFEKENYDIYYVEREHMDSLWSSPINLGHPVNTEANEFYPAIAASGNIYFTCVKPHNNGKDDIYMSAFNDHSYNVPVALDTFVNTLGYEFNAFIAPDESYIIFSGYNRPDGNGSGDLYISYKSNEGEWSPSKNMGTRVNSKYMDYCPFVDAETNTLYFTSRRINSSKKEFKNNNDLEREMLKYENGGSRIYKVKWMK